MRRLLPIFFFASGALAAFGCAEGGNGPTGGHGGATDQGGEAQGGAAPGAPRPLEVHVVFFADERPGASIAPSEGAQLMSNAPDGSLLDSGPWDAEGNATLEVIDGGFVTIVQPDITDGFMDAEARVSSIQVTADMQSLRFPIHEQLSQWPFSPPMTVDVSWPDVPGAEYFAVRLSCQGAGDAEAPATSLHLDNYSGCFGPEFEAMFVALKLGQDGFNSEAIAYGYLTGLPYAAGSNANIDFTDLVSTTPTTIHVSGVSVAMELDYFSSERMAPHLLPLGYGAPSITPVADGLEAEIAVPDLPLPLRTTGDIDPYPCGSLSFLSITDDVEDISIDPERLARRQTANHGFWSLGEGDLGDAVLIDAQWDSPDNFTHIYWKILMPAAKDGAMVPALEVPPELDAFGTILETMASVTAVPQPVDILEVDGYEAFLEMYGSDQPMHLEQRTRDFSCDPYRWE